MAKRTSFTAVELKIGENMLPEVAPVQGKIRTLGHFMREGHVVHGVLTQNEMTKKNYEKLGCDNDERMCEYMPKAWLDAIADDEDRRKHATISGTPPFNESVHEDTLLRGGCIYTTKKHERIVVGTETELGSGEYWAQPTPGYAPLNQYSYVAMQSVNLAWRKVAKADLVMCSMHYDPGQGTSLQPRFNVRDRVEAIYKGKLGNITAYPGTVKRLHDDGTFTIEYDDGDEEEHVHRVFMQKFSESKKRTRLPKASAKTERLPKPAASSRPSRAGKAKVNSAALHGLDSEDSDDSD